MYSSLGLRKLIDSSIAARISETNDTRPWEKNMKVDTAIEMPAMNRPKLFSE